MQLKIFKIDPPGLTTGLFDLSIGSGVFLLSAIASSTASGVLCGPISGHKKPFNLGQMGVNPHLSSWNCFLWPEMAGNRATEHPRSRRGSNRAQQKYAGADAEVEKAGCEAWGVDFDDFELHGIPPI